MRRGFNEEAEKAGLGLKERCSILGHSPKVNRSHYGGEKQIDREVVSEMLEKSSSSKIKLPSSV